MSSLFQLRAPMPLIPLPMMRRALEFYVPYNHAAKDRNLRALQRLGFIETMNHEVSPGRDRAAKKRARRIERLDTSRLRCQIIPWSALTALIGTAVPRR